LRRPDLHPRVNDGLIRSREEVRRMERLVRQLLDFGRPEPRDRSWTTASRVLTLGLASVTDAAAERGVEVKLDHAAEDARLFANVPRLEQALVNVLENATQAARSRVRVSWRHELGRVKLEIDDDGPGIPADQVARLFEPFFTTKPVGEGTGLGLSIAHSAVTEHDGVIAIEDSPLGGAKVILDLPAPPSAEEP
jgi:signal transduction histidine kinase